MRYQVLRKFANYDIELDGARRYPFRILIARLSNRSARLKGLLDTCSTSTPGQLYLNNSTFPFAYE